MAIALEAELNALVPGANRIYDAARAEPSDLQTARDTHAGKITTAIGSTSQTTTWGA